MRTDDQYSGAPISLGETYRFDTAVAVQGVGYTHVHALRTPTASFRYAIVKRTVDIVACFLLLPVLAPLFLLIILLIKMDSPGPAIFSHRRILKNGGFFSMWKFRTMCVDSAEVLEDYLAKHPKAKEEWARTHKLRHDPRVTTLGRVLRRFSLDELPQIWNVFLGEMTLVGPRPIVAAEVEKYGECFSCYCRVKPGVTGLWQVSGRSELSYPERVALDCKYVRDWSLWMDTKILVKTISCVVNSDGAF